MHHCESYDSSECNYRPGYQECTMSTATPENNNAVADGRKLRTSNSRQKIVDALLYLVRSGIVDPSAEEVAKVAKVGLRTVFRHFNEVELLHRELALTLEKTYVLQMLVPLTSTHWKDQVNEMLERLSVNYEHMMPYRVAAIYYKHKSKFINERLKKWDHITRQFFRSTVPSAAKEDRVLIDSLELILSFDSWIHLRMEKKLTPEETLNTHKRMSSALLNTCGY